MFGNACVYNKKMNPRGCQQSCRSHQRSSMMKVGGRNLLLEQLNSNIHCPETTAEQDPESLRLPDSAVHYIKKRFQAHFLRTYTIHREGAFHLTPSFPHFSLLHQFKLMQQNQGYIFLLQAFSFLIHSSSLPEMFNRNASCAPTVLLEIQGFFYQQLTQHQAISHLDNAHSNELRGN